ncbi:type I-E CRISPR-associated protein Cas6/Cse3/CasE [Geobacter sp. AOG1]|uniref:type I-E CRISPR-associated protein Cas6/Cse3/CasE n=1 Tax=Geobacter sp. AOG1 TaxID=1566346 RepID=UPI001CC61144|nr:type I-E CRISPR-associated protein Cas6/Cse3/CasE [Geobacter sp. AOG1]GFE57227.1 type I-E CRISPR-associated protein Cas6/Cse3/CasE [Geobacter sp. AOG1]
MYFSLIRLRRDLSPTDIVSLGRSDGYRLHKMVWDIFSDGPDRKRDFLYRFEKLNGFPTYYTISERQPDDSTGLWDISTKPYLPKLVQGERLAFKLRANPIQSSKQERTVEELEAWQKSRAERGFKQNKWTEKVVRHDVVMEAKTKIDFKNLPEEKRPHVATLIQDAGLEWLKSREEEYGFSVVQSGTRADGYCQHRLYKSKSAKPVTFSTLEFDGVLTVTEPGIFLEKCLFNGIGPAKGFGCGLMLVRRV